MTKAELIDAISKRADSTKADAERFLNSTLEAVQKALSSGDSIPLIGFGTFSVVKRAARQGRNPRDRRTTRRRHRDGRGTPGRRCIVRVRLAIALERPQGREDLRRVLPRRRRAARV